MGRFICLIMFVVLLFSYSPCLAGEAGGITDTNDCNVGDVLVGTGNNTGARSEGTWTDPSFLKGEKGDKGDTGVGLQGERGLQGRTGTIDDNYIGSINDLEETQINICPEIQFMRAKNYTTSIYGKYDIRHNNFPEVGLRITIGLGRSWEQIELEKTQERIEALEDFLFRKIGEEK